MNTKPILTNETPKLSSVRTTVCLPLVLAKAVEGLIERGGYTGLSDYLQSRIRVDAGLDRIQVAGN